MITWTSIDFLNSVITICILIIVFVVSVKIASSLKGCIEPKQDVSNSDAVFTGRCKFPDCVRCRRNKDVLMRARTRLTYCDSNNQTGESTTVAAQLLKDIQTSYKKLTQTTDESGLDNVEVPKQNPIIFHVKGIRAQPVWDAAEFAGVEKLSEKSAEIQKEFDELFKSYRLSSDGGYWKVNETSSGRWGICHLLDQGVQTSAVDKCPVTWSTLCDLPCAMSDCVFANVAFSVIEPGTTIAPHYGPSNIRIRCHLGLHTPPGCQLTVADQSLQWTQGKLLCFDETYLHGVTSPAGREEKRAVLIVDLWHPDLSVEHKTLISFAFTSSTLP